MASNQRNPTRKSAPRTVKDFARRKMPIRQFDTSDLQQLQLPQIEVSVVRSDANHLLMTSLLEQLCNMYVADRSVARQLFKNLCEQLGKLNIIAPLTMLDEMSGLRNQHRAMFNKIMQAAIKSLKQPLPALPENDITRIRLAPAEDDIIGEHTSRYKNEFREIEPLGKGGFGTVYKAENYLDGRQYAVKKIRFKHKHTHKLIKLLREVKALANLQHSNIVGYNAAWMEYDSPFCSSNSSSSGQSKLSRDTSRNVPTNLRSSGQDRSMSIEFLSNEENDLTIDKAEHPILPGGGGMAICAHTCSSVKVQELNINDHGNINIGVTKVQSQKDLILSPKQHVKTVDVDSELNYHYQSKNVTSCISSSFSFSENISNSHSLFEYDVPLRTAVKTSNNIFSKLKLPEKEVSHKPSIQQSLEYDLSQSCSFATAVNPHDQGSSGAHDAITDFSSQVHKISGDIKLNWEVRSPEKHGSFGFSTNKYRRCHSQPESGMCTTDGEISNSYSNRDDAGNKNIVACQQYQKRGVSHDMASDVEEVIELFNHDDNFYVSFGDHLVSYLYLTQEGRVWTDESVT